MTKAIKTVITLLELFPEDVTEDPTAEQLRGHEESIGRMIASESNLDTTTINVTTTIEEAF